MLYYVQDFNYYLNVCDDKNDGHFPAGDVS